MYPRNAASPPTIDLGQILQLSDGAVQTSGASVRVKIGTGSWGAGAGSLDCDATSGIWTYAPTQAETNDAFFVVAAYKSGCSALSKTVITSASATAGYAGLDWSKINAPTTTVGLSGTTIKTATDVETDTVDIQSRIPTTLDNGLMRSSVEAVANGVLVANSFDSDYYDAIAAAVGSGMGTGARTVTITVNDGASVLQNAIVRLSQGVENYVGKTNSSGVIVFAVDDATWDVAITKSGYRFTPTTLVVDGAETRTYSMTARAFTPSEADKVTGYWTVLGEDGEPKEGVVVTVRAIKAKSGSIGLIHVKTARTETTDSEGIAEFANMLPGWSYSVSLDGETIATVAIASDATDEVELGSCILAE